MINKNAIRELYASLPTESERNRLISQVRLGLIQLPPGEIFTFASKMNMTKEMFAQSSLENQILSRRQYRLDLAKREADQKLFNTAMSALQAVGGTVEAISGGIIFIFEPSKVGGAIIFLDGLDNVQAGVRGFIYSEPIQTIKYHAGYGLYKGSQRK